MNAYDVVVVGGGIGGLTTASLLSARGMKICLLERQSQVGGCIGRIEFSGYDFEPGMGLYTSFGPGGIYEKLFAELPVNAPEVSLLTSPYVVRQADGTDVQLTTEHLYSISGGPASFAEQLAESIKRSGGNLRLNSPVLRLAYDKSGRAIGVDLLSGERVLAGKAIVSNLTIWDTYGKLVGLNRTPPEIKKHLNSLRGTGVYVVYASMEEAAVARLPAELMRLEDSEGEFTLAIAANQTVPPGKRAVTFTTRAEVDSWFTYQSSEDEYEQWDQAALEHFWKRLHTAVPELGSDIEIIETANPRTYYDSTRRKLGMVLGTDQRAMPSETALPNVFMIGDTVSSEPKVDSVVQSAVALAEKIMRYGFTALIILFATMHFWLAGIGTAQEPTQRKPDNKGRDQARSSVQVDPLMPDFVTRRFTFDQAQNVLRTTYHQERIQSASEPSSLPFGTVVGQDPPAGTLLTSKTIITLRVSNGTAPVQPIPPNADLSVSATLVKKGEYWVGEPVQYTIIVRNAGRATATNVQITNTPTNLANLTFDTTSGECINSKCTITSIDAGSPVQINVTATIAANGSFKNIVTVTATEPDPNPADNTSEDNAAEANSSADVSATARLDTVGPFRAGQPVQYTMIIRNAGPSNATNIKIINKPTNLTITEVSDACNKLPCTIPNLAAGAVATIVVTASIDRDGSFENAADVRATEHDANPDNNNIPNMGGGIATSAPLPSPSPPPPTFPPWWWPIPILILVGLGIAGGGTYLIWNWTTPGPSPPVPPTPPPVSPPPPDISQLPPTPVVRANVDLKPGNSVIDGLQMAGPQIRLQTGLEMGGSTFDTAVPIVRREVINE